MMTHAPHEIKTRKRKEKSRATRTRRTRKVFDRGAKKHVRDGTRHAPHAARVATATNGANDGTVPLPLPSPTTPLPMVRLRRRATYSPRRHPTPRRAATFGLVRRAVL